MAGAVQTNSGGRNPALSALSLLGGSRDIAVAVGVIVVVMMIIIPMPTLMLDAFMALNLIISLLILLIVLYIKRPIDFNIFPTILLVITLFGLALNVSSTRLILTQGANFNGQMIRAFSTFVVGSGGNEGVVVGLIIFIVIIAMQVVVITKGSTRIAEVAARFALDSMQNKYLAIDTEFTQGTITEEEAAAKRAAVRMEIDFYGAMDGASKFISGSVKVGIFITVINILGGIIIGAALHGEPISMAVGTYIAFAIGDGLMSQLPALLVSTAVGMMVTRSVSNGTFAEDVSDQFTRQPPIYWVCAGVLVIMGFFPGFPWYVLWLLAALLGFFAWRLTLSLRQKERQARDMGQAGRDEAKTAEDAQEMSPIVPLDPLSLELGYGLIPLVDQDKGAQLLEQIQRLRRETALELGLLIPKVRIVDNMRLDSNEYCFKIKGDEVGRGKIRMGHYLCINPHGSISQDIPGERTRDPTFGMPAIWVEDERRDEAERAGYTVVDPPSLIVTHLAELVKSHAASILGRQETQAILDTLKKDYPAVVEEATKALSLGEIERVLQGLLKEQVSIRNMVSILEAISDYAPLTKNVLFLTEKAREALGRLICLQYADEDKTLHVLRLEHTLEQQIIASSAQTNAGQTIAAPSAELHSGLLKALNRSIMLIKEKGWAEPPIILCQNISRYLVRQITEVEIPGLVVLSDKEITPDINIDIAGEVRLEQN